MSHCTVFTAWWDNHCGHIAQLSYMHKAGQIMLQTHQNLLCTQTSSCPSLWGYERVFRADCRYQNSSRSLLLLFLRALKTWSGNCVQMDEMFWCSARSRLPLFIWDPDSHLLPNGWMYASHTMEMPFFSCDHNVFSSCNAGGGSKVPLEWWQLKTGQGWQNNPSRSFPTGQGKLCWWYGLRHPKVIWYF